MVRPSERLQQVQEIKQAKQEGDEDRVRELLERHDVNADEVEEVTIKQIFSEPGWVRSRLIRTTIVWLLYSAGFVASNTYITKWLTAYRGFSSGQAIALLLVGAGFATLQLCTVFLLPHIPPGQELEDVAT